MDILIIAIIVFIIGGLLLVVAKLSSMVRRLRRAIALLENDEGHEKTPDDNLDI